MGELAKQMRQMFDITSFCDPVKSAVTMVVVYKQN